MGFMWLLMSIVLVAVICTAREIMKGWRAERQKSVVILSTSPDPPAATASAGIGKHSAKWLSMNDCETLLRRGGKVVFIAIRAGYREEPLPFPGFDAISIQPNQLDEVLRWLPPGKIAVLCGQVSLCSSKIRLADAEHGTAIYILRYEPAHSKAG